MVEIPSPMLERKDLRINIVFYIIAKAVRANIATFSDYSMDPHNVVVRNLTHDSHLFFILVHHFLGGESLDYLYSNSFVVHLSLINFSILTLCKRFLVTKQIEL